MTDCEFGEIPKRFALFAICICSPLLVRAFSFSFCNFAFWIFFFFFFSALYVGFAHFFFIVRKIVAFIRLAGAVDDLIRTQFSENWKSRLGAISNALWF